MSDTSNPAPAGNVDANPNDLMALANSLPDDALDFDDGDTEDTSEAPQEPRRRQPKAPEQDRPAEGGDEPDEPATAPEGDEEEGDEPAETEEEGDEKPEGEGDEKPKPEKPEDTKAGFVEIDGHKVPIEEVRRGFMRTADYTRKTQAVAEQSRQNEALKAQVEAERGELGNILNIAVEVMRTRLPQPPSRDLIRTDPMGYMEQSEAYNSAVEEVNKLLGAQQTMGQKQTAEQQAQERERQQQAQREQQEELQARRSAAEALQQSHPHLFTDDGWTGLRKGVEKHSKALGLDLAAFSAIQDPRAFPVIELATKYLDLQAAKPAALERVKAAPPIRPAVRQAPGTRSGDTQKRALDRLRREGTIEAAAATLDDSVFD